MSALNKVLNDQHTLEYGYYEFLFDSVYTGLMLPNEVHIMRRRSRHEIILIRFLKTYLCFILGHGAKSISA